jgi:hypothetical protein
VKQRPVPTTKSAAAAPPEDGTSVQLIKEKKKVELNGKKFACIK